MANPEVWQMVSDTVHPHGQSAELRSPIRHSVEQAHDIVQCIVNILLACSAD